MPPFEAPSFQNKFASAVYGSFFALRSFRQIAANGRSEPNMDNAATGTNVCFDQTLVIQVLVKFPAIGRFPACITEFSS